MQQEVNGELITVMTLAGVRSAFEAYSRVTGIPMRELVGEALQDFAAVSIESRMEAIQQAHSSDTRGKVVCIDAGGLCQ